MFILYITTDTTEPPKTAQKPGFKIISSLRYFFKPCYPHHFFRRSSTKAGYNHRVMKHDFEKSFGCYQGRNFASKNGGTVNLNILQSLTNSHIY